MTGPSPLLRAAAVNGAAAVALGAFGAHGMKARLINEPARSAAWATASSYQLGHALAAAVAALPDASAAGRRLLAPRASMALTAGSLLFSGSLYAYAASGVRVEFVG